MDEEQPKRSSIPRLLWLLVIVGLVVIWWHYRTHPDQHADVTATPAEVAALGDPDDILVDLKDDASPAQIAAVEHAAGIHLQLVDSTAAETKLYRAHVDPAQRDRILAQLATNPEVEIAEPDFQISLSPEEQIVRAPVLTPHDEGYPNDPQYKFQWHMRQIGMPEAWKLADGNGVTVAVLDTGVAYEDYKNFHLLPDLAGITFVDPYDFVANSTHANDDHGHGSHVTGTIAQVTNNGIGVAGIARNVKIMPLKVLSGSGSGSVAGIADAIRYAADKGAKVINMSLGGAFPSNVLKKAVAYAHKKGVTVICAAGNESRGRVGYPAAYPGAVAVSATQFDETTTFYSNYGKDVDIAAPGGNTRVDQNNDGMPDGVLQNTIAIGDPTKDDYYGYMGTSMASPHVAGVAALVVGEGVTDPTAVEKVLKDSSRKPAHGKYERDRYGSGILDAPAAVREARTQTGGLALGVGALMAGAVAFGLRRKAALGVKLGVGYLGGVLVGASGLFFLPYVAPGLSALPGVHMLTMGLPSWDLSILGVAGHGSAVFFSALIPLVAIAVGYSIPRARPVLAGLAIGVAAHLAVVAVAPLVVVHAFGLGAVWLFGNALACLGLARLALKK